MTKLFIRILTLLINHCRLLGWTFWPLVFIFKNHFLLLSVRFLTNETNSLSSPELKGNLIIFRLLRCLKKDDLFLKWSQMLNNFLFKTVSAYFFYYVIQWAWIGQTYTESSKIPHCAILKIRILQTLPKKILFIIVQLCITKQYLKISYPNISMKKNCSFLIENVRSYRIS